MVAILAVLCTVNFIAAGNLAVSINEISVNDVSNLGASSLVLSAAPGEAIPVVVMFTANADLDDLKLKVWIDGYKSDISASTARFDVISNSTYIKRLALTMPNTQDMKEDLNQDLTLHVSINDRTDETEKVYAISLEKESYDYDLLYVDAPNSASAGESMPITVVLKNTGADELIDSFVTASIPELGISKKVYFGDLQAQDNESEDNVINAKERTLYLAIPSGVKSGDYLLQVSASNYDASATVKKDIRISGSAASNSTSTVDISAGNRDRMPNSILVLTIVLVVIFVVLLVVLIVLLTKKPSSEKSEDYSETSYY